MVLLCDSRERWTHPGSTDRHISGYLSKHRIQFRVQKLDVGDYMMEGGTVTVDRKASIEEISGNLTNPADKKRFWREVRLAHQKGLRLVVLVESNKFRQVSDLREWASKFTPTDGPALIAQMNRLRLAYGVEFRFCPKVSAARTILEILEEGHGKENREG